jgi:hypothetical protein
MILLIGSVYNASCVIAKIIGKSLCIMIENRNNNYDFDRPCKLKKKDKIADK